MSSEEEGPMREEEITEEETTVRIKKPSKAGVIYLSTIPPKMNVTQMREYFSQFGEIHRSYLQPQEEQRGRKNRVYTEGWIEYKKRRHAKKVAQLLNNTPLGGKKKHQNYDFLWNIKYLPGLQWAHINERLAYERISRQQKIRAEVAAAKREASFFARSVGLNKKLKRKMREPVDDNVETEPSMPSMESASKDDGPAKTGKGLSAPHKDLTQKRIKLYQTLFADNS